MADNYNQNPTPLTVVGWLKELDKLTGTITQKYQEILNLKNFLDPGGPPAGITTDYKFAVWLERNWPIPQPGNDPSPAPRSADDWWFIIDGHLSGNLTQKYHAIREAENFLDPGGPPGNVTSEYILAGWLAENWPHLTKPPIP